MIEQLSTVIIHLIQTTGYLGIFLLMALESALIPIPSEVTMPFAGFLTQQGVLNFWFVVLVGAFGNLIGSLIAFSIGYYLEERVIVALIEKYGKFISLQKHEYERAVKWFRTYGTSVVFFSRLLPAVRTFISLPAGLAEMNIWKFSIYTFVGSFLWSVVLTYVGFYLGNNWQSVHPYFSKFQYVVLGLLLLGVIYYIYRHINIVPFRKKKD